MLIPAIDLKGGKVVQLIQGEKLAIETTDLDYWIGRFAGYPRVNVIDLDAAMGRGRTMAWFAKYAAGFPARSAAASARPSARSSCARSVRRKSSSARRSSRTAEPTSRARRRFAETVGVDRVIGAVDSKGGRVVTHGWKSSTGTTAVEAVRALEPYCGEFLYTHVDKEGLMKGTDIAAIRLVRDATRRPLIAAGGVTTQAEIDELDALGIDAVVGMAIYTGALELKPRSG